MDLLDIKTEDLKKELERREREKNKQPCLLAPLDLSNLIEYVEGNVAEIAKDGYGYKDFKHYVFEVVMETLYGEGIWEWWNKNHTGE
jgi:hypothetical protein